MKKPKGVSHYLVLKDLIKGVDVRAKSDSVFYLTSRIENVKCELNKQGLDFIEDVTKETTFSHYKPYILTPSSRNIKKAEDLIQIYATDDVLDFLEETKKLNNGK
ncbi:hypothetical protein [Poseidonibacter ostreae]|uniref:Uncharacterized protein n=1 Tax=Poseidonibacter ostreae TaxID=2654171 RepID=A0ABQ6VJQ4_9BACT|nr:hypothetical protein [Poseidonibacter ostreae]KAB7889733.1 hypothetical protein GBG18_10555 [Poseidonibacter ostreae]